MSQSHHFRGIDQYAEQLMDLAEGWPAFTGRGQKPSNKHVLAAIASIKKCRQGSFFHEAFCEQTVLVRLAHESGSQEESEAAAISCCVCCNCYIFDQFSEPSLSLSVCCNCYIFDQFSEPSFSLSVCCNCYTFDQLQQHHYIHQHRNHFSRPVCKGWIWTAVLPKFDRSDFQSPTISELRAIGIVIKTSPGKLDLLVYRSGLTVAQVQRYVENEVREHYLMLKSKYIELWDKVLLTTVYHVLKYRQFCLLFFFI